MQDGTNRYWTDVVECRGRIVDEDALEHQDGIKSFLRLVLQIRKNGLECLEDFFAEWFRYNVTSRSVRKGEMIWNLKILANKPDGFVFEII